MHVLHLHQSSTTRIVLLSRRPIWLTTSKNNVGDKPLQTIKLLLRRPNSGVVNLQGLMQKIFYDNNILVRIG